MIKLTMRCAGIGILCSVVAVPLYCIASVACAIGFAETVRGIAEAIGAGVLLAAVCMLGGGLIVCSFPKGYFSDREEEEEEGEIAKTKDGVPVVWGMKIFDESLEGGFVTSVSLGYADVRLLTGETHIWVCGDCYSTKAANEESGRRERERVDSG